MTRLVVVDTNVLVAALLTPQTDSPTARTLDAMLNGSLMFLLSPDLLVEYRAVLLRPKLAQRHGLTETEVDELLAAITANAIWRELPAASLLSGNPAPLTGSSTEHFPPDAGDAHLWALLAGEPAAVLITGDLLLLNKPYPNRVLMQPRQFWEAG
jgi:putative PIN family toxin of toxin-antitoxin system